MKKLMVFAMAAMVALASCTKTELVDNSAPTPISFKTVKGSVTKSDPAVSSVTLNGNVPMGVFAYVNKTNGHDLYFRNYKFVADIPSAPTSWGHEEDKAFWPFESSLDFVVYAPWESENDASYSSNTLTISNANISPSYSANSKIVNIANQTDYLYGASYFDNTDDEGYTKTSNSVNVDLNHAAAKVTVSFTGKDITICDVSLENPVFKGSYTVEYDALQDDGSTKTIVDWTPSGSEGMAFFNWAEEELSGTAVQASMMVVPETITNIYFTYKIADTEVKFTAKIPVTDTWKEGTHYTYNISVSPEAITFNPTVNDNWSPQTGSNGEIDYQV